MADMLDEGVYRARPIPDSAGLGKTRKGTKFVSVEFELLDAPSNGNGEQPRMTWYGWLSHKALEYTVKSLRACGWQGNDIRDLSTVGSAGDVLCTVKHDDYGGELRAKIDQVCGLDESPLLTSAEQDKLAEALVDKIAALGKDGKQPALLDDDIPF